MRASWSRRGRAERDRTHAADGRAAPAAQRAGLLHDPGAEHRDAHCQRQRVAALPSVAVGLRGQHSARTPTATVPTTTPMMAIRALEDRAPHPRAQGQRPDPDGHQEAGGFDDRDLAQSWRGPGEHGTNRIVANISRTWLIVASNDVLATVSLDPDAGVKRIERGGRVGDDPVRDRHDRRQRHSRARQARHGGPPRGPWPALRCPRRARRARRCRSGSPVRPADR